MAEGRTILYSTLTLVGVLFVFTLRFSIFLIIALLIVRPNISASVCVCVRVFFYGFIINDAIIHIQVLINVFYHLFIDYFRGIDMNLINEILIRKNF